MVRTSIQYNYNMNSIWTSTQYERNVNPVGKDITQFDQNMNLI